MSLAIRIRPQAQAELQDAYDWYERQAPGLGERFLAALDPVFDEILRTRTDSPAHMGSDVRLLPPSLTASTSASRATTRSLSLSFMDVEIQPSCLDAARPPSGTQVQRGPANKPLVQTGLRPAGQWQHIGSTPIGTRAVGSCKRCATGELCTVSRGL